MAKVKTPKTKTPKIEMILGLGETLNALVGRQPSHWILYYDYDHDYKVLGAPELVHICVFRTSWVDLAGSRLNASIADELVQRCSHLIIPAADAPHRPVEVDVVATLQNHDVSDGRFKNEIFTPGRISVAVLLRLVDVALRAGRKLFKADEARYLREAEAVRQLLAKSFQIFTPPPPAQSGSGTV